MTSSSSTRRPRSLRRKRSVCVRSDFLFFLQAFPLVAEFQEIRGWNQEGSGWHKDFIARWIVRVRWKCSHNVIYLVRGWTLNSWKLWTKFLCKIQTKETTTFVRCGKNSLILFLWLISSCLMHLLRSFWGHSWSLVWKIWHFWLKCDQKDWVASSPTFGISQMKVHKSSLTWSMPSVQTLSWLCNAMQMYRSSQSSCGLIVGPRFPKMYMCVSCARFVRISEVFFFRNKYLLQSALPRSAVKTSWDELDAGDISSLPTRCLWCFITNAQVWCCNRTDQALSSPWFCSGSERCWNKDTLAMILPTFYGPVIAEWSRKPLRHAVFHYWAAQSRAFEWCAVISRFHLRPQRWAHSCTSS